MARRKKAKYLYTIRKQFQKLGEYPIYLDDLIMYQELETIDHDRGLRELLKNRLKHRWDWLVPSRYWDPFGELLESGKSKT